MSKKKITFWLQRIKCTVRQLPPFPLPPLRPLFASKRSGKMQASMTMQSVAGLGLGVRARLPVRSRVALTAKPGVFGAPVVGKSIKGFAARKSVTPMAMAMDNAVPQGMKRVEIIPVAEAPFVGIFKDMKTRAPLYIDDFVQGVSFKSVVSFLPPAPTQYFFPAAQKHGGADAPRARALRRLPGTFASAAGWGKLARHAPIDARGSGAAVGAYIYTFVRGSQKRGVQTGSWRPGIFIALLNSSHRNDSDDAKREGVIPCPPPKRRST